MTKTEGSNLNTCRKEVKITSFQPIHMKHERIRNREAIRILFFRADLTSKQKIFWNKIKRNEKTKPRSIRSNIIRNWIQNKKEQIEIYEIEETEMAESYLVAVVWLCVFPVLTAPPWRRKRQEKDDFRTQRTHSHMGFFFFKIN